jgi:N-acetyl-anhydromuramyl-L-alanine amidase AmpD
MKPEDVKYLVVHCADTPPDMDIGAKEIDRWHRKRGFNGIGYHYVIRRDGTLESGRPLNIPGAHAKPHNRWSIGICLVGGRASEGTEPENNFTDKQRLTLSVLLEEFVRDHPKLEVVGHRDLNPRKACPSFDVKSWWQMLTDLDLVSTGRCE